MSTGGLALGTLVVHRTFGRGRVVSPPMAGGTLVRVRFASGIEPLVWTQYLTPTTTATTTEGDTQS